MDIKFINKIYIIVLLAFVFGLKANAETMTFKGTISQALENSFDIKMTTLDIDISKAELKAARADWYPIVALQGIAEHNQGLGNYNNAGGYYAGSLFISPTTAYRNMTFLSMNYNLFDFGATGKKVLIAKKDVAQKRIACDLQKKELKLKVLELYTKILQANEGLKTQAEILKVYEDMFKAKERMFKAGVDDKISVMDEAVKIAKTQDEIQNAKLDMKKNLQDLSSYTLKNYKTDNLEVLDFDEMNIQNDIVPVKYFEPLNAKVTSQSLDFSFNPSDSPEAKFYDFEIEKKKAELSMYKRQRFPSLKLYSNYSLYGQDPSNYSSALNDLQQRSWAIGISANYTFFDGFKNRATCEKAALEIKRLQIEKEKKLNEIKVAYEKSFESFQIYNDELVLKKDLFKKVTEKLNALDRMNQSGLIDKTKYLVTKADLLNNEYNLQKNIYDITSKLKEMEIMAGKDL